MATRKPAPARRQAKKPDPQPTPDPSPESTEAPPKKRAAAKKKPGRPRKNPGPRGVAGSRPLRKTGPKPHEPTNQTRGSVLALAGFGVPQGEVAAFLGLDEKTLRKHYRAELDSARIRTDGHIMGNYYKIAAGLKGKPSDQLRAGEFWMRYVSRRVAAPGQPGDDPGAGIERTRDWIDGADDETLKRVAMGEFRVPSPETVH